MPSLDVPGATLTYNTIYPPSSLTISTPTPATTSPQLHHILLIPGAPGTSSVFSLLAPALAARSYTVTIYTRRGYSGSPLTQSLNPSSGSESEAGAGLDRDADDVAALLMRLISEIPAPHRDTEEQGTPPSTSISIFATSSGAIVALALLQRHPSLSTHLTRVLLHEPPLVSVFSGAKREALGPRFRGLYELYERQGAEAAVRKWISLFPERWERGGGIAGMMGLEDGGEGGEGGGLEARRETEANMTRWLELEMRQFTSASSVTRASLDGVWADVKAKVVLMAGEQSFNTSHGKPLTLGAVAVGIIAEMWGQEVRRVPGGHIGYANEGLVGWFAGVIQDLVVSEGHHEARKEADVQWTV